MPDLISLKDVRDKLSIRYRNQRRKWFAGEGEWPYRISLGLPSESFAMANIAAVRGWSSIWADWQGPGHVEMDDRNWPKFGTQTLPSALIFNRANEVASFVGDDARWNRAAHRRDAALSRWPALANELAKHYDELADYTAEEWARVLLVLENLPAHRNSGLYLRQLPLPGIDTKWLENHRGLIRSLLGPLVDTELTGNLVEAMGLRDKPQVFNVLVLDPLSREGLLGLRHFLASIEELAQMKWKPLRVIIIENDVTALAMPDIPGVVVIAGKGFAVNEIARLPWLRTAECWYWGDIDSDGITCLGIARRALPSIRQILMDEATMERHKELIVHHDKSRSRRAVEQLTPQEQILLDDLLANRWGEGARLEQERIDWQYAVEQINKALCPVENLGNPAGVDAQRNSYVR